MTKPLFICSILMIALSSCLQKQGQDETSVPTPEAAVIEIKLTDLASDKDLVCGMAVEEGAIADTASYEGKIYGFCASECKHAFLADPVTYLAQP